MVTSVRRIVIPPLISELFLIHTHLYPAKVASLCVNEYMGMTWSQWRRGETESLPSSLSLLLVVSESLLKEHDEVSSTITKVLAKDMHVFR
jgi:hypothetical protein